MEIIVALKQVPSTEINTLNIGDNLEPDTEDMILNPYCEIAIEEALRIKEAHGGRVTVISAGGDHAEDAVRTGIAMGADHGIHIIDTASDPVRVAKILAKLLKDMRFDLIITGERAVDDDSGIVGPALAQLLDIPAITYVFKAQIVDQSTIECTRALENETQTVQASLPALFTAARGLNEPRCLSLKGIKKSKKAEIEVKKISYTQDICISKTKKIALKPRPKRKAGIIIEGDSASQKAAKFVKSLYSQAKVI